MKNFHNRVIAITGAGSGIGQALALAFTAAGAKLALSDINDLNETVKKCTAQNNDIEIIQHTVDVSSQAAVAAWAKDIYEHYDAIHIIINNAGVSLGVSVEAMEYIDLKRIMDINYWGVVYGTKEFMPYLRKSDAAHIINISSLFGLSGIPNQSAYCSAKFAVRGFTQCLNLELNLLNSNINCGYVCPGGIKTNIVNNGMMKERIGDTASIKEVAARFDKELARTTADQAAIAIIQGIQKNKVEILVGADAKILQRLIRFFPQLTKLLTLKLLGNIE